MKKFAAALIAFVVLVQSSYAAIPPLTESLLEYDAIITAIGAPSFTTIPVTEFIIDIRRITKRINILGEVEYAILTRSTSNGLSSNGLSNGNHESNVSNDHYHHQHPTKYIATLNVAPNPGIGPNIVTVLGIEKKGPHNHHNDD